MKTDPLEKHPFITWFASNPVVANLLMLIILVWGFSTALSIRKEAFPSFEARSVTVQVPFNGGVPEDVERGVAIKIEEALEGVEGIDHVRSTSSANGANVTVSAIENYPLTKLFNEIKVQVDAISTFPGEAEKPIITERRRKRNVMWIDIHGDVSEKELKETARAVRDELIKQPDIDSVETVGSRDYEISLEVSEDRLRAYDLTFEEVATAVRANSVDLSGGFLRSARGDISLRTSSQAYNAADFAAIPLRTTSDGVRVLLGDVADIRDGFVDQIFMNRFDGKPTVSLQVTTNGEQDIIKAASQAGALAETYAENFDVPAGVSITGWSDGSEAIRSRLSLLTRNGLQGGLLVLISLSLFLNLRLAFWVAIGIPVSIAGAFILFAQPGIGLSLNMITAFSFIVVLGIIVDDAIVLGEAIFTEKEANPNKEGEVEALRSTVRGVSRVVTPATFGVLTTVAAFFPLTQVSGHMGNVFGQIATGVICCLIFSLVESKLILPSHLAHLDVHRQSNFIIARIWRGVQGVFIRGLKWIINSVYRPVLGQALRFRYITVALFVAGLIVVGALLPSGKLRFVFFPPIYQDDVTVIFELEEGLPVDHLHENVQRIADALLVIDEEIVAAGGESVVRHIQVAAASNTKATIGANLTSSESRAIDTGEIVKRWRKKVGPVTGAKSLTFSGFAGPPGQGLAIQLESKDLDALRQAATELKAAVADYPGVADIKDSFSSGRPEIQVKLTPAGQASGFDRRELANGLRAAFYGFESQRVQRGRDEVKVMVRYPKEDRGRIDTLREMRMRSPDGTAIPFSIVAETSFGESLAAIERADYNRVVTISADVDKTVTSGDDVLARLQTEFFPVLSANYPDVAIALRGEAEQRGRSVKSLMNGLMMSVVLIYILLAIPLKSFGKPLFIMSVIPFGIIGALMGHYIVGIPVSILSLFGILALSGIVVNDSLVLICRIDDLQAEGKSLQAAVLEAGPQRFRAILLTTLTTFIGLMPILVETSTQAQFLKPMAVSVAFGVVFATVITLILLPILLVIVNETVGSSFAFYRGLFKK